jgi:hypothetical protein
MANGRFSLSRLFGGWFSTSPRLLRASGPTRMQLRVLTMMPIDGQTWCVFSRVSRDEAWWREGTSSTKKGRIPQHGPVMSDPSRWNLASCFFQWWFIEPKPRTKTYKANTVILNHASPLVKAERRSSNTRKSQRACPQNLSHRHRAPNLIKKKSMSWTMMITLDSDGIFGYECIFDIWNWRGTEKSTGWAFCWVLASTFE